MAPVEAELVCVCVLASNWCLFNDFNGHAELAVLVSVSAVCPEKSRERKKKKKKNKITDRAKRD